MDYRVQIVGVNVRNIQRLVTHDNVCAPGLVATTRVWADIPPHFFTAFGVQTLTGGPPRRNCAVAYPRHLIGVDGSVSVADRSNSSKLRTVAQWDTSGTCSGGKS